MSLLRPSVIKQLKGKLFFSASFMLCLQLGQKRVVFPCSFFCLYPWNFGGIVAPFYFIVSLYELITEAGSLCCCPSCPVHLNSIAWETWAIWSAVKKYTLNENQFVLLFRHLLACFVSNRKHAVFCRNLLLCLFPAVCTELFHLLTHSKRWLGQSWGKVCSIYIFVATFRSGECTRLPICAHIDFSKINP